MIESLNIKGLLTGIFLIVYFYASSIDFTNLNTRYWYDPNAAVQVDSRVISFEGKIRVFFKINHQAGSSLNVDFLIQQSFEDPNEIQLADYTIDSLGSTENTIIQLTFPSPNAGDILVLRVFDSSNYYYFPIELKRGGLDFPPFYPGDEQGYPIVEKYISNQTIRIKSPVENISYYLYQYNEAFPPADPPMGNVQKVNPTLRVDSLMILSKGTPALLSKSHFYFVQSDTLSTDGFTLYAGSDYFPEYRDIEKIILPVTYFTKSSEMAAMLNARDKKLAFDRFWLSLYTTKIMAKSAIASYYKKVWLANRKFTDYKEGWKTDRGIIYLIFGNPAEVYRHNKREYWIYDDVQFEFRIISNLFAPNLYILIRDEDYESFWLEQLKLIRGGK